MQAKQRARAVKSEQCAMVENCACCVHLGDSINVSKFTSFRILLALNNLYSNMQIFFCFAVVVVVAAPTMVTASLGNKTSNVHRIRFGRYAN